MTWKLALVGGALGLLVAGNSMTLVGLAAGVAAGVAFAWLQDLRRRIELLEKAARGGTAETRIETAHQPPAPVATALAESSPASAPPVAPRPVAPAPENRIDVLLRLVRQWLTTGNVPVKIGVIVSFFGVAFLLKYAVEHQLIAFPLELRLLSVAAIAIVLLATGWRLRARARVYALSIQGAGLGILYMTTFAAYRLYGLMPSALALALLVALTIAGGALAVLQNARGLALFGVVGGFLAPILASSGSGDHVVLFSYYLVLNALILGVAWFRPWRELNLVGFAFTFVIGGVWAWSSYETGMYASTQPFVILHFLFYQAVAVLYARRHAPRRVGVVDGTLVFATPVLVFAMQAVMLRHTEFGLAYSAVVAAAFYAATATGLARDRSGRMRLLIDAYLALAVVFATLAIPLALDARWTAASWALEGAALVWIGERQGRALARAAGVLLVFGAGLAFMNHGWRAHAGLPVLNGNVLGGTLIALSSFFAARRLGPAVGRWPSLPALAASALVLWGVLWWLGTGAREVTERVAAGDQVAVLVAFVGLSAMLLSFLASRWSWTAGTVATYASLPMLGLVFLLSLLSDGHPLARFGTVSWPLAFAIQIWLLRRHEAGFPALSRITGVATAALLALVGCVEAFWQVDRVTGGVAWPAAAAAFVPGSLCLLATWIAARRAWPASLDPQAFVRVTGGVLLALQWLWVGRINLDSDGDASPLPFVPLLNPADIAGLFALLVAWHWLRAAGLAARGPLRALVAAAFVLSTLALLRATHQLGDVPWQVDAMVESVLVQASLSVYWGLLAFAAMVIGARRSQRGLWSIGAGLMGLVVLKLFVVELGGTGTVERIVSFMAVGALLLVVGYLAPVPPRRPERTDA